MTALAITLPLALVLAVYILAAAAKAAHGDALASRERLAEARDLAGWQQATEARIAALEEQGARIEEQSAEVLRRARAAGLGERLGKR